MKKPASTGAVPLLLAMAVPVLSAALIPWALFSAFPIEANLYYEFPIAELGATFVAALFSVGLSAWAVMRAADRRPGLWHVVVALVSGVASATTLWFLAWVPVITRLQGLLCIWGALLALWVVLLLRSLTPVAEQPRDASGRRHHQAVA